MINLNNEIIVFILIWNTYDYSRRLFVYSYITKIIVRSIRAGIKYFLLLI